MPFMDHFEAATLLDIDIQSTLTQEKPHDKQRNCHDNNNVRALPADFFLTPYCVIIGKGKIIKENLGNKRLRILASIFLPKYSNSNDKRSKTLVVNEVIRSIQSAGGSFVRKESDGRLYRATDQAVREKIGYVFRDLLCDKYRSSSKSKVAKRQKEQLVRASMTLERAMHTTHSITSGIPACILSCYANKAVDSNDDDPQNTSLVERPQSNVLDQISSEMLLHFPLLL